jgi:hypothetical protein
MTSIDQIEKAVQGLSEQELAEFRAWFAEFDHARWDQKLENDAREGKLDALADEALGDHDAGRTRPR